MAAKLIKKEELSGKAKSIILGLSLTLFISALIVFGLWNRVLEEPGIESVCTDINGAPSMAFESCFDLDSETIFLTARRNLYEDYNFESIKVTFFDTSEKEYEFQDIPPIGEFKVYYLTATKNPRNAYIQLSSKEELNLPTCTVPRRLFIKDCNLGADPIGVPSTTRPSEYIQVDLRSHLVELEQKELAWETKCSSTWQCGEWEDCVGGIQRRTCADLSSCFIPTRVPETVRHCSNSCIEHWQCTWSSCTDGLTTPECTDLNNCGTTFSKPSPVSCSFTHNCIPDIECTDWSDCSVEYTFLDLQSAELSELPGIKERVCSDKNSCTGSVTERTLCSTGIDIYTQRFQKCGTEYVDVHDNLDNSILARIETGDEANPQVNIRLDIGGEELYCDYCYNGVLDGDEVGIDCGGSCGSCLGKQGPITLRSKSFFARIGRWFAGLF